MVSAPQLAATQSTQNSFIGFVRKIWRWLYRRPSRYEAPYCDNLLAIYHGQILQDAAVIRSRIEELQQREKTPDVACELELLNLHATDPSGLPQIVTQLRKRWGNLNGDPINQKASEGGDTAELLSEASLLTAQIHRQYALQQVFDAQKRWILFWMFFWFIIATGILGYLAVRQLHQGILFEEMLAGVIGGYTSSFMRVYQMEAGKDLVTGIQGVRFGVTSLIVKPALGGIFAILLHLLFLSKAFSGGMFPALSVAGTGDKLVRFVDFFVGTVEATSVDFAKLLVWCFIAGFAERFVPDVLDSMANKAAKA